MIRFVSKFVLDILPSVVATVIGAYIVNHYIIAKPAPPVAAMTSSQPASAGARLPQAADKAHAASDRPEADKRTTAATASVEKLRRDHAAAGFASRPRAASASSGDPRHASAEPREANELARAAIERLRSEDHDTHAAESSARAQDPQRVSAAMVPTIQPLPPALNVSIPEPEAIHGTGYSGARAAGGAERDQDPPTPPREIPVPALLLGPENPSVSRTMSQRTVADDMFAAAKSVFHAVLPH